MFRILEKFKGYILLLGYFFKKFINTGLPSLPVYTGGGEGMRKYDGNKERRKIGRLIRMRESRLLYRFEF